MEIQALARLQTKKIENSSVAENDWEME